MIIGTADAVALLPTWVWQRELFALFDRIRLESSLLTLIFLLGVQPIGSITAYDSGHGIGTGHAHAHAKRPVEARDAQQLSADPRRAVDRLGSLDPAAEVRCSRVVALARSAFGTRSATSLSSKWTGCGTW